jgi:hypothetical protein
MPGGRTNVSQNGDIVDAKQFIIAFQYITFSEATVHWYHDRQKYLNG